MKPAIWIFSLEPIATRYTVQWHTHLPNLLEKQVGDRYRVIQVDGVQKNTVPTQGAFLNFSDTNYWKSSQLCTFLEFFNQEQTTADDHFIFADAWNPVIVQIKYMKELLGFDWKLHGLWHAGSYDPQDFLGRLIGNKPWVRHSEHAMFHALDHNYFATTFHIDMFWCNLINSNGADYSLRDAIGTRKVVRCGWPFEFLYDEIHNVEAAKKNMILFPHRIAPEKQLNIFKDLAASMPQYEWIVSQEEQLTKPQYHAQLAQCKLVFSANLQETLGIGCYEALCANAIPLVPDRLSYSEMYSDPFVYPSNWTKDWSSYQANKAHLIDKINVLMSTYHSNTVQMALHNQLKFLSERYFSAGTLMENL